MIYETRLRFNISLREVFPKSRSLTVMKKCDEISLMQIFHRFGTLQHVDCEGVFLNSVF